jgi:TetR/AcrR family transcriptional regulator, mexJK operon transcriptional repressor
MTQPSQSARRKTFTRKRLEDARLEELFAIAAGVFLAGGFSGASTNEIARRAHASKATFYSRFPTKEDLFVAVIEHRMERIFKAVTPPLSSDAPPEAALRSFGSNLIHLALTREQVGLVRLIGMEAGRFPKLARRFFEAGPALGQKTLAAYMRQCIERGSLRPSDPVRMAEHFISLVTGGEVRWFVLGLRPRPARKRLQDHLDAALRGFLQAYGSWAANALADTR